MAIDCMACFPFLLIQSPLMRTVEIRRVPRDFYGAGDSTDRSAARLGIRRINAVARKTAPVVKPAPLWLRA
jgi:hypothetical protein